MVFEHSDVLVRLFLLSYRTVTKQIMKNLFIAAGLVLALSANASITTVKNDKVVTERQDKEYKKIEESKVPAMILKEIATKYDGYTISDTAVSIDEEYRITVTKDSKTTKVYFTGTGEFVKEEK